MKTILFTLTTMLIFASCGNQAPTKQEMAEEWLNNFLQTQGASTTEINSIVEDSTANGLTYYTVTKTDGSTMPPLPLTFKDGKAEAVFND